MLSKVFGSKLSRAALLTATKQHGSLFKMGAAQRNISLLVNDQFLDEEQKLI